MKTLLSILVAASPTAAGAGWRQIGQDLPIAGIGAQTLIADPTTPSTLYAISNPGLLFKSTDGSDSWRALSGITGVRSLLIDPRNSSILFAGTSHGVVKSSDAGLTWTGASSGLSQGFPAWANVLAIDPTNSSILYVQKYGGIFKTADGGQSWNALNDRFYAAEGATTPLAYEYIQKLIIDPSRPSTMYAGVLGTYPLFKSTDGGVTWYAGVTTYGQTSDLALDPVTSALYLAYFDVGGKGHILISTDQATTWTPADPGLPDSLFAKFEVDSKNSGTLYVWYVQITTSGDTSGFAKSIDGGNTWNAINSGLPANYPFTSFAIDSNSVLYASFSNGLNFGGIFKSSDRGATWRGANAGPGIVDIPALAIDPANPEVIYAAAGADGVFRSADRGWSWSKLGDLPTGQFGVSGKNAVAVAIDSGNPDLVYALTTCLLFKSTDGGVSWNSNGSPQPYCLSGDSLSMDPHDSNTLYLVGDGESRLQKTSDGGMSWSYIWQSEDFYLQSLTIDQANPTTIYAGTSDGLLKTADSGASWSDTGLHPGVGALAIDPLHPNVVYAATATDGPTNFAGLLKSTDGGASWSAIDTGLEILADTRAPVTTLAFDPANPDVVFAGTSGNGIFRSTDGGTHWTPFSEGLGSLNVRVLATAAGRPDLLYASTTGGLFAIPLSDASSGRSGRRRD